MFARIAPLKRLPKNLEICDYKIPEALQTELQVGQLITIPFRRSKIFGLVLSLEKSSSFAERTKDIDSIVQTIPFFRHEEIEFLRRIALLYHIGLGPLLESALPPLQKRKIKTLKLKEVSSVTPAKTVSKPNFIPYKNETEHAKILQFFSSAQTLILIPEIHLIQNVFDGLSPQQKETCIIWHSELSEKEKFSSWQKIRNGETQIVIGTRSTIFLPFFDLKHIVVDYEDEKGHKHDDGSPRFHVKDIVHQKAALTGAQITFMSSHPSSETYYNIYKNIYSFSQTENITEKDIGIITVPQKNAPTLIDLKSERIGHKEDFFLSTKVQEEIANTKNDIFLFLNRRGSATSISCYACGYRDSCPKCKLPRIYHEKDKSLHCHYCKTKEPVPLLCPKCQTKILELGGYGTENLEKTVRKLMGEKSTIVRLDSDMDEQERMTKMAIHDRKVIIGTEISFPYLQWEKIGLVVCINLDSFLTIPEYSGEERLWHTIQKIQYNRLPESQFFIQTQNPEHSFWKSLASTDFFYRNDLKKRKDFFYPPYSYLVKYFYGAQTSAEAKKEADRLKEKIEHILTKFPKKCIIYSPIELHPHYYRNQYWYGIIILIEPIFWTEVVEQINTILDEHWKVDPRPNTLLAP